MKLIILALLVLAVTCQFDASKSFNIAPGDSKSFNDSYPIGGSATCTVTSTCQSEVCVSLTSGSGQFNGANIGVGSEVCKTVSQGTFTVSIDAYTAGSTVYKSGTCNLVGSCSYTIGDTQFVKVASDSSCAISKTFNLAVGKSGCGTSPLPIAVSGNCTITSLEGTAELCGNVTAGQGNLTFDGQTYQLSTGDEKCFNVTQGDSITAEVSASAGGCGIYKSGQGNLTVSCCGNFAAEIEEQATEFVSTNFSLTVGENKQVSDPLPFPATASCTVTSYASTTVKADLCVYILSGSGTISLDGGASVNVSNDESNPTCVQVVQGSKLTANVGASVVVYGIYKSGDGDLKGTCSVDL